MANLGNLPGQRDVPRGNPGFFDAANNSLTLPYAGYHAYTAAPWQQYQPNSRLGGDLVHAVPYNQGAGYANGLYNYQHLGDAGKAAPKAGVNPAALSYWQMVQAQQQQAAQAAANSANAGNGPGGGGSSGGGSGGGGGGGVAMPNIAGLQAGINQQFDQRVALLKQLLGEAHTGIGAVGNQVNQQLGGLAKDSSAEGKKIAADIAAQYASQRKTAGTDQAALLADLQRNGANVGVLQATNAQQNQNLSGEQGRQAALDARLQQVLGSSMANRQAGAVAQTGGFQQQLDTKGMLLQQQLDAQRAQAMQALQQQIAVARAGGGGGGRRGGGGYGRSGSSTYGPPTTAEDLKLISSTNLPIIDMLRAAQSGNLDLSGTNPGSRDASHQWGVFQDIINGNPGVSSAQALNLMGGANGPAFRYMDPVQRADFFRAADNVNHQITANKGWSNQALRRAGFTP